MELILFCLLASVGSCGGLIATCWIQAVISGWLRLANAYHQPLRSGGRAVGGCLVQWSNPESVPVSYLGSTTGSRPLQAGGYRFSVFEDGLQVDRPRPFGFFHPPLFVPWSDVHLAGRRRSRFEFDQDGVSITFTRVSDVRMHISDVAAIDLLKLGVPFRANDDGQLVRIDAADCVPT